MTEQKPWLASKLFNGDLAIQLMYGPVSLPGLLF
jgi:hypothetical protein